MRIVGNSCKVCAKSCGQIHFEKNYEKKCRIFFAPRFGRHFFKILARFARPHGTTGPFGPRTFFKFTTHAKNTFSKTPKSRDHFFAFWLIFQREIFSGASNDHYGAELAELHRFWPLSGRLDTCTKSYAPKKIEGVFTKMCIFVFQFVHRGGDVLMSFWGVSG